MTAIKYKPYRELLYLFPPLLVYLFAGFLFELSVDPDVSVIQNLLAVVKGNATHDLPHQLIELKARYVWLASALLQIVVSVMSIMMSVRVIKLYIRRPQLAWTIVVSTALCIATIGHMLYSARTENAFFELIFGFTYKMLARSEIFSGAFLLHVYIIISILNILASITPIFLLMAVCATLCLPMAPCHLPIFYMARRMRRLKEIINFASAFLVFGILHMSMWLNWAASLFDEPELSSKIAGVAWSISAYWGVAFTLVLTVTYLSSTIHLKNQAQKQITRGNKGIDPNEVGQLLDKHGFTFTINNQLTQCISIMAPFLAAPISHAFF